MAKKCGFIALAGRPNAGKSTFLNHVLGEKVSIVSDKPQTTRNKIMGVYHGDDLQIGFLDLPGIHKPKHKMNRVMMRTVVAGLEEADLIFHFVDISAPIGAGDRFAREFLSRREIPVVLVLNKMDLINKSKAIALIDQIYKEFKPAELIPISAKTGDNLDQLLEIGTKYLEEGEQLFEDDALTDQPLRFMARELIREKLLHYTRDEIPHSVAVTLEQYEFDEEQDTYVLTAIIWAERTSQRRIILGNSGKMISKITRGSRQSLRQLLGKPVELELFVKVEEKWRDKETMMDVIEYRGRL